MEPVVGVLGRRVLCDLPREPLALYLTGSACAGGLHPDSDLDLLMVTRESLTTAERRLLVDLLRRHSGRRATTGPGRPIELTSVVVDDLSPWRYPAICDFVYGEWLRADYDGGALPRPETDANLPVLLTAARQHAAAVWGPPPATLLPEVPASDLRRSLFDALPTLLDHLVGDERNVLLTLARMLYTLETGSITAKDEAAEHVLPTLTASRACVLRLAAQAYRGETTDDWTDRGHDAQDLAGALVQRLRELGD